MPHFRIAQKCQEISQINKASLCHLGKSKSHSLVAFHVAICTLSWGKKMGQPIANNCKKKKMANSSHQNTVSQNVGHSFPSENVLIHNMGIG